MLNTNNRKQIACFSSVILIGAILITRCQAPAITNTSTSTNTPLPEITVQTAELIGELEMVDGCLRVKSPTGTSYALAWTPNLKATIEEDKVHVEIGVLLKNKREVILDFGKMIGLVGGEMPLDEQTQNSLPPHCPGPYWVVGDIDLNPNIK